MCHSFYLVKILATYFDWFGDLFDRMYKDGKDLTWKTFCESEQPENPSKVNYNYIIVYTHAVVRCIV